MPKPLITASPLRDATWRKVERIVRVPVKELRSHLGRDLQERVKSLKNSILNPSQPSTAICTREWVAPTFTTIRPTQRVSHDDATYDNYAAFSLRMGVIPFPIEYWYKTFSKPEVPDSYAKGKKWVYAPVMAVEPKQEDHVWCAMCVDRVKFRTKATKTTPSRHLFFDRKGKYVPQVHRCAKPKGDPISYDSARLRLYEAWARPNTTTRHQRENIRPLQIEAECREHRADFAVDLGIDLADVSHKELTHRTDLLRTYYPWHKPFAQHQVAFIHSIRKEYPWRKASVAIVGKRLGGGIHHPGKPFNKPHGIHRGIFSDGVESLKLRLPVVLSDQALDPLSKAVVYRPKSEVRLCIHGLHAFNDVFNKYCCIGCEELETAKQRPAGVVVLGDWVETAWIYRTGSTFVPLACEPTVKRKCQHQKKEFTFKSGHTITLCLTCGYERGHAVLQRGRVKKPSAKLVKEYDDRLENIDLSIYAGMNAMLSYSGSTSDTETLAGVVTANTGRVNTACSVGDKDDKDDEERPTTHYCSRDARATALHRVRADRKVGHTIKLCRYCGNEFEVSEGKAKDTRCCPDKDCRKRFAEEVGEMNTLIIQHMRLEMLQEELDSEN